MECLSATPPRPQETPTSSTILALRSNEQFNCDARYPARTLCTFIVYGTINRRKTAQLTISSHATGSLHYDSSHEQAPVVPLETVTVYDTMDTAIDLPPRPEAISPSKTPTKVRSFSDPPNVITPSTLAPSPTFRERPSLTTKDDNAVPTTPRPVRRPELTRGLSLQMPPSMDMPSPSQFPSNYARPVPLSPKLDQQDIYMQSQQSNLSASPVTSLPRHSRGLDFSRACTNLHHSTVAESSPDSSPVITQKAMVIPGTRKGSVSSMMLDSPNIAGPGSMPWGPLAAERSTVSSSVGSVNMMGSEDESTDSDEDASMAGDDNEDGIFTTPQVHKLQNPSAPTPFHGLPTTPGGGSMWGNGSHFSPAQASLMKTISRTRLRKDGRRSRKDSSSGSGYSSMASPRATSPPPMRSIESAANNNGYFNWATAARSRRESLALGTDGLHLSSGNSGNDSGDEASALSLPSTPGVVRRPVTRRGNLLPKTKGFARIKAALMEESAPVDSEVRREAETIRQVRERDGSLAENELDFSRPQTATAQSSPNLLPAVPESGQEDFGKDLDCEPVNGINISRGLGVNFSSHASRNSGGLDYWNRFDPSVRTPPPPSFQRQSSSVMSDINMDSEPCLGTPLWRRPRARSSASDASEALAPNSAAVLQQPNAVNDDVHLKRVKRRREDDFDIATIKRRAVSPGMSAQNSPVLAQSPSQKEANGGAWGHPPERKDKSQPQSANSEVSQSSQPVLVSQPSQQSSRHGSGGSSISLGSGNTFASASGTATPGRKLGLQGMVDTNDGLMKMSIE